MQLNRTINRWSCLPASFGTVFGLTLEEMFKAIGHDGSTVVFPELEDPERRRAFHPQEMIDVAENLGYVVTPIEARPTSKPSGIFHPPYEVPLETTLRFQRYLEGQVGVLTGRNLQNRPHAVVWDGVDSIHDPALGMKFGIHMFQTEIFWRVTRQGSPIRLSIES
jgi:hypothetical protein